MAVLTLGLSTSVVMAGSHCAPATMDAGKLVVMVRLRQEGVYLGLPYEQTQAVS
jgi:hypothetical protein